jgi:Protein of unknown function (DUF3071)
MHELRLVGLNEAGTHLVLAGRDGMEFIVALDERLAAAMRRDRARLGQLQIKLEPQLRPREIQARLRSGESIADVAAAAQVSRDHIERFAGPVLAERQHVAMAALRALVRRRADGAGIPLGEIVTDRLEARGVAAEGLDWDAWRRDDGRWTIQLSYHAGGKQSCARWVYDTSARQVTCEDDEARWLTEDRPQSMQEPARPTVPRLVSLPPPSNGQHPNNGQDADELFAAEGAARRFEPVSAAQPEPAAATAVSAAGAGQPANPPADANARDERLPAAVRFAAPRTEQLNGTTDRQAIKDGVRPGKRATVPSWDEIVFGRRQPD